MKTGLVAMSVLVLAVMAGAQAFAFEKQKAGTASVQPDQSANTPVDPALGLSDDVASRNAESGTEIRIPGLGSLGVLPKMDFGLELLYGAADQKPSDGTVETAPTPDDLMIRGSVKHRF